MQRLADAYDVAFFDLDGVIYLGPEPVEGAAAALAELRASGVRVAFVTNNAAPTAASVAKKLTKLGFPNDQDELITSAQAAAHALEERLHPGSMVLVCGTHNLVNLIRQAGLNTTESAEDDPVAVIMGYDPEMTWPRLDEAALALQRGATWFATNPDLTRPTNRGLVPGLGSMINAVGECVPGLRPEMFGKPYQPLFEEMLRRTEAEHPIFVGDRLDTDIEGARVADMDSLFVLSGSHGKQRLVEAVPAERPTYLGWDVGALLAPARVGHLEGGAARCGNIAASVTNGSVTLSGDTVELSAQLDALWATCLLTWETPGLDVTGALAALDLLP